MSNTQMYGVKKFRLFTEGIDELCKLSFSVAQSLASVDSTDGSEVDTIRIMVTNDLSDGRCKFVYKSNGVAYTTSGGLIFGWERIYSHTGKEVLWYKFFISPPNGVFREESTLLYSIMDLEWEVEVRDVWE